LCAMVLMKSLRTLACLSKLEILGELALFYT
jgi:hypothetical protein